MTTGALPQSPHFGILTNLLTGILTDLSLSRRTGEAAEAWKNTPDVRLDADSIAKVVFPAVVFSRAPR